MQSKLNEKHLKALAMLESNQHSITEIAKSVGINYDYLCDLMSGGKKTGPMGVLFHAEYQKIKKTVEERITAKVNQTRDLLVSKLLKWAQGLSHEDVDSVSRHRMLVDSINALTRAVPLVNIESNTWQTNLSGKDMVNEFKRIRALAKASAIRKGVSGSSERGAGEVSLPSEAGYDPRKTVQDLKIPAQPQARRVSFK